MDDEELQFGLELGSRMPPDEGLDIGLVREDLEAILEDARTVTANRSWDERTLRYKKIVFLQLTKLLPDVEADQLSFDFLCQVERIEALLAA